MKKAEFTKRFQCALTESVPEYTAEICGATVLSRQLHRELEKVARQCNVIIDGCEPVWWPEQTVAQAMGQLNLSD